MRILPDMKWQPIPASLSSQRPKRYAYLIVFVSNILLLLLMAFSELFLVR